MSCWAKKKKCAIEYGVCETEFEKGILSEMLI